MSETAAAKAAPNAAPQPQGATGAPPPETRAHAELPRRKPGEAAFAAALAAASLWLLWEAYGISQFEALSSPGAFPMAAAAIMAVSAVIILIKTLRLPGRPAAGFFDSVAPPRVLVMFAAIAIYGVLLAPLGFLPTSLLFLTAGIFFLRGRGLLYALTVSAGSLLGIYLLFRIVFTVLMPAGIVPEGEILAFIDGLFEGAE